MSAVRGDADSAAAAAVPARVPSPSMVESSSTAAAPSVPRVASNGHHMDNEGAHALLSSPSSQQHISFDSDRAPSPSRSRHNGGRGHQRAHSQSSGSEEDEFETFGGP